MAKLLPTIALLLVATAICCQAKLYDEPLQPIIDELEDTLKAMPKDDPDQVALHKEGQGMLSIMRKVAEADRKIIVLYTQELGIAEAVTEGLDYVIVQTSGIKGRLDVTARNATLQGVSDVDATVVAVDIGALQAVAKAPARKGREVLFIETSATVPPPATLVRHTKLAFAIASRVFVDNALVATAYRQQWYNFDARAFSHQEPPVEVSGVPISPMFAHNRLNTHRFDLDLLSRAGTLGTHVARELRTKDLELFIADHATTASARPFPLEPAANKVYVVTGARNPFLRDAARADVHFVPLDSAHLDTLFRLCATVYVDRNMLSVTRMAKTANRPLYVCHPGASACTPQPFEAADAVPADADAACHHCGSFAVAIQALKSAGVPDESTPSLSNVCSCNNNQHVIHTGADLHGRSEAVHSNLHPPASIDLAESKNREVDSDDSKLTPLESTEGGLTRKTKKKKVLIVYASIGSGHKSASRAIDAALKVHRDIEVSLLDIFDESLQICPSLSNLSKSLYYKIFETMPALLAHKYEAMNDKKMETDQQLGMCHSPYKLFIDKIRTLVENKEVDLIVNTHWRPADLIDRMFDGEKHGWKIPTMVVHCDYMTSRGWAFQHTQHSFVATEEGKVHLYADREALVNPDDISVTGVPVDPKYAEPANRKVSLENVKKGLAEDAEHEWKLRDDETPIVVLMGGGEGLGPVEEAFHRLLAVKSKTLQIVALPGSNAALRGRLLAYKEEVVGNHRHNVIVLGFCTFVPDLLAIASVLVGKPGGLTVTEVLGRGTTMMVLKPNAGQESYNCDYLVENGAAWKLNYLDTLTWKSEKLFENKDTIANLHINASRLARRSASKNIAQHINDFLSVKHVYCPDKGRYYPSDSGVCTSDFLEASSEEALEASSEEALEDSDSDSRGSSEPLVAPVPKETPGDHKPSVRAFLR